MEKTGKHRQAIMASSGMSTTARNMVFPCPCGLSRLKR